MLKTTPKPKVLIVDDDAELAGILRLALARLADVATAANWTDGKARLAKERYRLLLLDLFLPDAGLLEPLEYVRELDPDYPVVLMSGNLDRDDQLVERAMRMGVNTILRKPFDLPRLEDILRPYLA